MHGLNLPQRGHFLHIDGDSVSTYQRKDAIGGLIEFVECNACGVITEIRFRSIQAMKDGVYWWMRLNYTFQK